jgi:hypothetical protein
MGDTLKDCCYVLGSSTCLNKAYEMIKDALTEGNNDRTASWQAIEAPLFAMRSMGAEVDFREDKVVPLVMDLLPNLPNHPRIHYAAILVVSRYTEWIDLHPTYIPFLLSYLSSGFEKPDSEETAAAAQAMKYLCRDCRRVSVSHPSQPSVDYGLAFGGFSTATTFIYQHYWTQTKARRSSSNLRGYCSYYIINAFRARSGVTTNFLFRTTWKNPLCHRSGTKHL